MTIAITADLHLTSRAEHPARFQALEDILDQMLASSVGTLVIAGDLFDQNRRDLHEFEDIVRRAEYRALQIVILPGNHDAGLTQASFSPANVLVMDHPRPVWLEEGGLPFFFLPYRAGESAGAQLVPFRGQLPPDGWFLVSHGDYTSGLTAPGPNEPGVYMPLTRADVAVFQPVRVFLGHTHLPFQSERVISPGSPAAVDSTETGRRGFWLVDPRHDSLERRFVRQGPIYVKEDFLIIPSPEETASLKAEILRRVAGWGFSPEERNRVNLLAAFNGCAADRSVLRTAVLEALGEIRLHPDGEPDFSHILSEDDPAMAAAAALALDKAAAVNLSEPVAVPDAAEINRAVLRLIYGEH
jgi:DNA repair exonuclease SbcCD nuclease subunit